MTLLQVSDLAFGYGANRLFEGVTFSVETGDRVALVAPNGAGKTTLLRLVAGELAPDEGSVVLLRGMRLGFYRQSHEHSTEGTVMDAFLSGFRDVLALRHALTEAQERAASGLEEDLDRLTRATDAYHIAHGDELERKVESIAGKLGFRPADMQRPVESLSGGERGRLHLGVVLAQDPDVLLLDEPTNHLDLDTIDWLEGHIGGFRGAVLSVSHDRAFLDAVAGVTLELGHRSFRTYPLRYSDYAVAREADLARERELAERQQAMIDKTEDFIRKNIAGQKTKQAQSRRKMLEKLEKLERPEDVWAVAEKVRFRFAPASRSGDIVLDAKGLSANRGGRELFEGFDLLVRRGERIGIVGPNGSGKSTLLKLLAGEGDPADEGEIKRGTNLEQGYFDQHLGTLDSERSAIDEIRSVRGDLSVDATRQYLARFRFYGDDTFRKVGSFSGGERSRLSLAKLLLEPRNLLFLDEPTNHLDIPAAEILEEALTDFPGTVLLVSHDRRFLENVTTRLISLRDGICEVYPGGFRDFVADGGAAARTQGGTATSAGAAVRGPAQATAQPLDDKAARKAAFEQSRAELKALDRKRKRIAELEDQIAEAESKAATLREKLKTAPGDDWEKLAELATEERALTQRIESMMLEWSNLSEETARTEATCSGGRKP